MRIAVVSQMLTGGGAERVASLWIKGFLERNHTVALVMNTSNPHPITYPLSSNVKVYNMYDDNRFHSLRNRIMKRMGMTPPPPPKFRSILDEFRPDVIICLLHPYAIWALKSCDEKIPIVNTEHNSFERPKYAPMSRRSKCDKFVVNKKFEHVTVLTHRDYEIAKKRLKNISVLPNPLTFKPCGIVPQKEKIILVSARLSVWHCKGLDLIIKAWGRVSARHPEWCLKIAGRADARSKNFLMRLAKHAGVNIKQIGFLGFCDDILPLYQRAEIFVLGSRYEGFGMSLIEAMSQGCACISCDFMGRQREIIQDDSQGIICPVDNIELMADAMEKMIVDDQYRKTCQKNAVERSRFFALSNIMEKWDEIFKRLNLV